MNSDEVFLRAALYEECAKSSILKHIDVDSSSIETLRELLNKNNALVFRKLPIILSKLVIKHGLTFAKSKISQLHFLTPENINVNVESDEMQYLLETQSSMRPNIIFMVSKNILLSVVGSSIASFKDELLSNSTNAETEQPTKKPEFTKISVEKRETPEWSKAKTPTEYTNVFDTPPDSIKSMTEKLQKLSRSSSRSSLASQKSRKLSNVSSISSKSHNIIRKRNSSHLSPSPIKDKVNIISNVVLKKANDDDNNDNTIANNMNGNVENMEKYQMSNEYSDMDEEFSDDNNENDIDDENTEHDQCINVKLSDLQETRLKAKTQDFYEMVNSVVPPSSQQQQQNIQIEDVSDDESVNYTPKIVNVDKDDKMNCEIVQIANTPIVKNDEKSKTTPAANTKIITIDDDDDMFNDDVNSEIEDNDVDDDEDDEDDII